MDHQNIINKGNYDYELLCMMVVQEIVYISRKLPFVRYLVDRVVTMN